jgi:hypothetical protein
MRRIFPANSGDPIYERAARVVVLYEDLRLEVHAISADQQQLTALDFFGHKYREFYFIRRAMVTFFEFAGALDQLQTCQSFKAFKRKVQPDQLQPWSDAVKYFAGPKREQLKTIRDAVGGHFGSAAAQSAVNNISPDYVAKVRLESDMGAAASVTSEFVTELVATAVLAHCPGNTQADRANHLTTLLTEASEYAAAATRFLLAEFVWPRFEG